jgi:hypothetical protein
LPPAALAQVCAARFAGKRLLAEQGRPDMDWSRLFPAVNQDYAGARIPFYFLILVAVVSTVRSLIHVFAPDGGAGSIAGIQVNVQGGANIIALFAQWGALQLILAILYWLVILRYRFLVPTMLAVVIIEQLFRLGAGQLKPLDIAAPPPGAIGSQLLLPLAFVAFLWSLRRNKAQSG